MRIYKNENGSITLFVLVSMLFLTMFLATIYTLSTNNEIAQRNATAKLKETYENGLEFIEETYNNLEQAKAYNKDGNEIKDFEQGWNFNYDNDTEIWKIGYFGEEEVTEENTPYYIKCGSIEAEAKTMKNYKIEGNSIQNGTPSTTTPIPILNLGKATKNLFDKNSITYGNYYIGIDGQMQEGGNTCHTNYISIEPSTTYVRNSVKDSNEATFFSSITWYDENKTFISGEWSPNINLVSPANAKYLRLSTSESRTLEYTNEYLDSFQLEKGSTSTEYVANTCIDIINSGKNLFKYPYRNGTVTDKGIDYIDNEDGSINVNGTATEVSTFNIINYFTLPAGTYFMSGSPKGSSLSTCTLYVSIYKNGEWQREFFVTGDNGVRIIVYDGEVCNFCIRVQKDATVNNLVFKPMLEKGEIATIYEPYREPIINTINLEKGPLRRIGNVVDYIDYNSKKIVRNIGELILKGTETIGISSTADDNRVYNIDLMHTKYAGLSTHFIHSSNVTNGSNRFNLDYMNHILCITYKDQDYNNVNDFKTWLTTQYSRGTPVTIYYQLVTPIEEDIELPKLPIVRGSNIYSIDADVQPSNFIIEY